MVNKYNKSDYLIVSRNWKAWAGNKSNLIDNGHDFTDFAVSSELKIATFFLGRKIFTDISGVIESPGL